MNTLLKLTLIITGILSCFFSFSQVAINEDNSNPDASAMLDVKSTDKWLLIPRLDSTQRVSIVSPVTGWLVFQFVHLLKANDDSFNPGFYFMKINYFVLFIIIFLSIDSLL